MKKKIPFILLILLLMGIAVFSGYQVAATLIGYSEADSAYDDLQQYVSVPATQPPRKEPEPAATASPDEVPEETAGETEPVDDTPWPMVNFDALWELNDDVVAWLYSEGTTINYPVAQGYDNNQYLRHLLDGTYNTAGTLFLDYRNEDDFSGRNSIIYGHKMKNGSMFASLLSYESQEYYEEHPVLLLVTPEKNYKIELFTAYLTSVESGAWKRNFDSDEAFLKWCERAKDRSYFECDVTPTAEDRILTLSTCSYAFENARFIVAGILREVE